MDKLGKYITFITYIIALIAFLGYKFISEYYELFGYDLSKVGRVQEHILLRSFNIFPKDEQFLTFLTLAIFSILLAISNYVFFIAGRKIHFLYVFSASSILFSSLLFFRVEEMAREYYQRDIDPKKTELQRLVCLQSKNVITQSWFEEAQKKKKAILILFHGEDRLITFLPPRKADATIRVELFETGISDEDIIVHTAGSNGVIYKPRSQACIR